MDSLRQLSITRGFFLRREAVRLGIEDRALTSAVRHHILVRIRHGAYCHRDVWESMTRSDQHLARAHAVYAMTPGDVALSHISAMADFGSPLWDVDLRHVHLTRVRAGRTRREAGVIHHRGRLSDEHVIERGGRLVTSAARSTVDALSLMSVEAGVVAGDWMLHEGFTDFGELWDLKTQMNHWPGTRALEVVLRLLDGGSESPGESRARYLFWWLGLPKPELQYPITDESGHLIAVTDFAWPAHGVFGEFDGKVKYGRLLRTGQQASDVVFAEKRREDEIRRLTGGTVVRWVWSDLHATSGPSQQICQLLRLSA